VANLRASQPAQPEDLVDLPRLVTGYYTKVPDPDNTGQQVAALNGLKVATAKAWFAARPSGTEDVYQIYAESFRGPEHLAQVEESAQELVNRVINVIG
jgi:phosphoglucomutase